MELALETLFDNALELEDPILNDIKSAMEKYKTWGNEKLLKKAKLGAVSYYLSKFKMTLIKAHPNSWNGYYLYKYAFDGSRSWLVNNHVWTQTKLKDFSEVIPFDVLKKIPNLASWGEAMVFSKQTDPVLAFPLGKPATIVFERKKWYRQYQEIDYQRTGFYGAYLQWD